jgi:hypothetical protein
MLANNKNNRNSARRGSKNRRYPSTKKGRILIAPLLKSYPLQNVMQITLPGTAQLVTTTVTTGVIAAVFPIIAASIPNFATRFGATWMEYRIVRVKFVFKTFSMTNPGLLTHWLDEKQAGVPTSAEALQVSRSQFSASSPSPHTLVWTSQDPLDLQYIDIGTIVTIMGTYKVYTDNANFGSSIVATAYGQICPYYIVQFRGLN